MAEDLVYYNARWRYAALAGVGLGLAAAGWYLLAAGKGAVGRAMMLFFGFFAAIGLWQLLDRRPRLRFAAAGLTDRQLGVGLIKWSDIEDAYLRRVGAEPYICLVVRNEAAYLANLPPVTKWLTAISRTPDFSPIALNLSGLAIDPEPTVAYILQQAAAARPPHLLR